MSKTKNKRPGQRASSEQLQKFLAAPVKRHVRCATCMMPNVAADVRDFADALRAGKTSATWAYFHREYLVPEHDYDQTYSALLGHVRKCLDKSE